MPDGDAEAFYPAYTCVSPVGWIKRSPHPAKNAISNLSLKA
ncbi:hypothetical protein A464_3351 [Salmonella bongori N268-08]|uniref:Uncharacterized protein n=1 Tax=Salmonella bongori N268-08 TaxID=1197719 RepID=S5ND06_SALBN|nr:hypothetical protein A464_3351 [Salmonella bongori N268-08]